MLTQYSATVIVVALSVLAFKPLHCAPIDDVDIDHLIAVKDPAIKANETPIKMADKELQNDEASSHGSPGAPAPDQLSEFFMKWKEIKESKAAADEQEQLETGNLVEADDEYDEYELSDYEDDEEDSDDSEGGDTDSESDAAGADDSDSSDSSDSDEEEDDNEEVEEGNEEGDDEEEEEEGSEEEDDDKEGEKL